MYPEGPDLNLFLMFINKILYPIVILKSEDEIERFRNPELEWVEDTPFYKQGYQNISYVFQKFQKVTRVIAFIDPKEFKEEMAALESDARSLVLRDELRIAKVVNKKLIKKYKSTHNLKWFDSLSSNSLVLFKKFEKEVVGNQDQSLVQYYDFATRTDPYYGWINHASLNLVEELTVSSSRIYEMIKVPVGLMFVNKSDESCLKAIYAMREVAKMYPSVKFVYTDNP